MSTDTWLEQRLLVSMYVHEAATLESLAQGLNAEAGERYAKGDDAVASYLRDELVPRLVKNARRAREHQQKEQTKLDTLDRAPDGEGDMGR